VPTTARDDPYHGTNFLVEIDGVVKAAFSEATGLVSETEVIEYRTGADLTTRKLPGRTSFANIVLHRGVTQDLELWNWRKSVVDGAVQRRNGVIVLLDDQRQPVLRYSFVNGWPCRWEGPDLDASANDIAIETLEIAHEGLDLQV
jgi:phage tail-like protein